MTMYKKLEKPRNAQDIHLAEKLLLNTGITELFECVSDIVNSFSFKYGADV